MNRDLPAAITYGAIDMTPAAVHDDPSPVIGIVLPGGRTIPVAPATAASPTTHHVYRGAGTYDTSDDSFITCDVCRHVLNVKKYPTRPVNAAGIITRKTTCRGCERARRTGGTVTRADGYVIDYGNPATVPTTDATTPTMGTDDAPATVDAATRMDATWANRTPDELPANTYATAMAVDAYMTHVGA